MNNDEEKTIRPSENLIPSDDEKTTRPSNNIINADINDQDSDKTIRIQNESNDDKTIRSNNEIINTDKIKKDDDSTVRADHKIISSKGSASDLDSAPSYIPPKNFDLMGVIYNHVKTISQNTGEGQIYLVEKDSEQFVLKHYLPNIQPKLTLVKKLRENQNNSVIKIFDFGYSSDNRFFELMEYLEGGTLDKYLPIKDPNKIKSIVTDVAEGLEFCHQNGIIHRDIKPSNIFVRKENEDDYILGDFGISSLFDTEARMQITTQARSDIYAAPEVYISRDGKTLITPKLDYYSLGLSIIFIWLGRNPFKGMNEMRLPQMKIDGQIKIPDDMPKDIVTLIKGLLVVKPEKRWGYEEIIKWSKGETVEVFEESIKLQYEPFIFDAEENLVAKTPADLAQLMKDDPQTAKRYLYAGKIDEWLRKAKNTKLELAILEIYEKLYPKNQEAGLTAALYTLDRQMPYIDIEGNVCEEMSQFADAFLNNFGEYSKRLSNKNDSFYLYLQSKDNENLAKRFYSFFKKEEEPGFALMRVIYELYPSAPLRFVYPENNELFYVLINSHVEVSNYFDKYHNSAEEAIFGGTLKLWLEAKIVDESLIPEDRENYQTYLTWVNYVIENYEHNHNAGRKLIVYVFDPQMGYLSEDEETIRYTLDDLAQELFDHTNTYKDRLTFEDDFFYLYMISRGWTEEEAYIRSCFDIDNLANNKIGPYDEYLATLKAMTYLGIKLTYYLEETTYREPNDLLKASSSQKKQILEDLKYTNSYLFQWLSLFYQENPQLDSDTSDYAYEAKLLELMEFVYKVDSKNEIAKKFHDSRKSIPKKVSKEKLADKRFLLGKLLSMILPVATAVILFLLVFFNQDTKIEAGFWDVTPLYFISFIGLSILAYFITRGYGDGITFINGFVQTPLVAVLASILVYYLFALALNFYPLAVGGAALLVLIYIFWKVFRFKSYTNKDVRNQLFDMNDKETFDYEPLAYAFSSNTNFNSARLRLLNDYNMRRHEAKKVVMSNTIMPSIIFFSLIILFAYTNKSVSTYLDEAGLSEKSIVSLINLDNKIPDIEGTWKGTSGNTEILLLIEDQTDLNITGKLLSGKENIESLISGIIDTANGKVTITNADKETFEGSLADENKSIAGVFTPKRGRKQNFNLAFLSSSIENPNEKEVEEPIEENKSAKQLEKNTADSKPVTKPKTEEKNSAIEEVVQNNKSNEVSDEKEKSETKPTKFYAAPLSANGVAFEVMDCYTLGANRVRVDYRVTNNNSSNMEIIIPAKSATLIDNAGNQTIASIRSLANVTATTNDVDVIYMVNSGNMAYGGLIFENLKPGATKINILNLKVDVNGSTTLKFTNIPIRIE